MIVHFFEPPAFQTIGGLNLAIQSLEVFLRRGGDFVTCSARTEPRKSKEPAAKEQRRESC